MTVQRDRATGELFDELEIMVRHLYASKRATAMLRVLRARFEEQNRAVSAAARLVVDDKHGRRGAHAERTLKTLVTRLAAELDAASVFFGMYADELVEIESTTIIEHDESEER